MSKPVQCPFCKRIKSVTPNMGYRCPCGARISIGSDGNIKSAVPK